MAFRSHHSPCTSPNYCKECTYGVQLNSLPEEASLLPSDHTTTQATCPLDVPLAAYPEQLVVPPVSGRNMVAVGYYPPNVSPTFNADQEASLSPIAEDLGPWMDSPTTIPGYSALQYGSESLGAHMGMSSPCPSQTGAANRAEAEQRSRAKKRTAARDLYLFATELNPSFAKTGNADVMLEVVRSGRLMKDKYVQLKGEKARLEADCQRLGEVIQSQGLHVLPGQVQAQPGPSSYCDTPAFYYQ